jgi:hypothetical protein
MMKPRDRVLVPLTTAVVGLATACYAGDKAWLAKKNPPA